MNRPRLLQPPGSAPASALALPRRAQAQARAGRRHALRPPAAAGAGAGRRQDRGDRVLLVRLPALQRLRAGARGLGQAAAGRRRLPPRAGLRSARSRSPPSSGSSTRSRRWACCRRCTARCSTRSTASASACDKPDDIAAFVPKNGVDAPSSSTTYNSFARADQGAAGRASWPTAYKIDGVPAIGVHGRYYTVGDLADAGQPAGPIDRLLGVVDALIAQGAAERPRLEPRRRRRRASPARSRSRRRVAGSWHRMACKFHAAMRNRHSRRPPVLAAAPSPSPCSGARAGPGAAAGPGREGRPLQAAERRGRPARHGRPAEAGRRLQRQRRRHQGHDDASGPSRIEVRETPDGYRTAVAIGTPASRPPSARSATALDEYIEGEAERLEYDGTRRHHPLRQQRVGAAPARRRRRPTRSPAT